MHIVYFVILETFFFYLFIIDPNPFNIFPGPFKLPQFFFINFLKIYSKDIDFENNVMHEDSNSHHSTYFINPQGVGRAAQT